MNARAFIGSSRVDVVPANDRGLAYGDGLFETMRIHRATLPWWPMHWSRLAHGAGRLRIPLPSPDQVEAEIADFLSEGCDGVLKLLLSRGGQGRGYRANTKAEPIWLLLRHPLPPPPPARGLRLRWCSTRLAIQPALAGLKHCNRLEQVLARAEWDDPAAAERDADEGLMCSSEGDVVCATAANLCVLRNGQWHTPPVDRCGVAGVCRAWLLDACGAVETRLLQQHVESADALVLCNAVRGILGVARLSARTWSSHPQVALLQRRLGQAHPAFAEPLEDS